MTNHLADVPLSDLARSRQTVSDLRAWYSASTPTPISIKNVLEPSFAKDLSSALAALPNWRHVNSLIGDDGDVRDVDYSEWSTAPIIQRWSSQRIAEARPLLLQQVPLDPMSRSTLATFFLYFIVGTEFRKWVSSITGVAISKEVTCEFAHYCVGDYITEHADRHDDRIIGVNLYLGPWRSDSGGRLGFRDSGGAVNFVDPAPNSMSLFRVLDGCVHWVEAWMDPEPGRRTISMSFREMK